MARRPSTWPTCVAAVKMTVSDHQHSVMSLYDAQGLAVADSAFTTTGPATWNLLPDRIRNLTSHDTFLSPTKNLFVSVAGIDCIVYVYTMLL